MPDKKHPVDNPTRFLAVPREDVDTTLDNGSRLCMQCGQIQDARVLAKHDYRCIQCNLESAHLDRSPTGSIRGVLSWLRQRDEIVYGRYQVQSLLGRGGFAATYLVEDLHLNRSKRALKEVPEILFDTYEADVLSTLNHPGIPDIIDRFSENNLVYLVLKFGGSRTLESEMNHCGGRIPLEKLLPWMDQICIVLSYLHAQNPPIIHRDLKPANILLDEHDFVKLIDFGISKQSIDGHQTRTLARAATHGFSPPEQVGGFGTDLRSDLYAMAATFYAAATGTLTPTVSEQLAGKKIIEPGKLVSNFPRPLNDAMMRALSLNKNQRQSTIQEFRQSSGIGEATRGYYSQDTGGKTLDFAPADTRQPDPGTRLKNPMQGIRRRPVNFRQGPSSLVLLLLCLVAIVAIGFSRFQQPDPLPAETIDEQASDHVIQPVMIDSNITPETGEIEGPEIASDLLEADREPPPLQHAPNPVPIKPTTKRKKARAPKRYYPRKYDFSQPEPSRNSQTEVESNVSKSRINRNKSWGKNVIVEY